MPQEQQQRHQQQTVASIQWPRNVLSGVEGFNDLGCANYSVKSPNLFLSFAFFLSFLLSTQATDFDRSILICIHKTSFSFTTFIGPVSSTQERSPKRRTYIEHALFHVLPLQNLISLTSNRHVGGPIIVLRIIETVPSRWEKWHEDAG